MALSEEVEDGYFVGLSEAVIELTISAAQATEILKGCY